MTVKNKLKKIVPDKMLYLYSIIKIFPKYVMAIRKKYIFDIDFYTDVETVDTIINMRASLARFGDGEFMWMSGERFDSFQEYSEQFALDLIAAFQNKNSNLLIGIPIGIFDSSGCNLYAKMHWRIMRNDFLPKLSMFIDPTKKYCNASISRPYIDYASYSYSKNAFDNLKRIWDGRDIIIVEGRQTKLGMGNDLFDNVKSLKRIICPSQNAYFKIEAIKESVRRHCKKDTLLIGALGPTASILAAQLTDEGYQFVDIGHIDIEYMWFLKKSILREPIDGKYVNESGIKECSNKYDDEYSYIDSIIDTII